jgi:leucyl aminopeptidase
MQVHVERGDITHAEAPCIVVNLFEGVTTPGGATGAVDNAMAGLLTELIAAGDIRGKWGELTLVHTQGRLTSPRVLVAGLGKQAEFTLDRVRELSANVARHLRARRLERFTTIAHGGGIGGLDAAACTQAIAEGTLLGLYRFGRHKKPDDEAGEVREITVVERDAGKLDELRAAAERGVVLAEAANFARDLSNEPGNVLTPTEFASRAEVAAREHGLGFQLHEREWAESMGMGAFLGVARGSAQPPKFMVLTYQGGSPPQAWRR